MKIHWKHKWKESPKVLLRHKNGELMFRVERVKKCLVCGKTVVIRSESCSRPVYGTLRD